jgi:alpha-L-fucosidase
MACIVRLSTQALAATWSKTRAAIVLGAAVAACPQAAQPQSRPYQETWDSLKTHQDPAWFRDAKFGIYTHWGPITVATENAPSDMEWYGRQLYLPEHAAFLYHQRKFGDQHTVGYKDVIPRFTAEKFNAEEWADLFSRAGAKFAGPVAVHHDNFAMWDSHVTRWNSVAMGPHRDITGQLAEAYRKRGLKFLTTFHHGFAWRYFEPSYEYDGADRQYWDLYAGPHEKGAPPSEAYLQKWLAMVDEAVSQYRPDLIWFDFELGTLIPAQWQRRMFAHYYNWASANNVESGVLHKHREIHQHTGILDFERGREGSVTPYPWITDSAVGPWFHHNALEYRSTNDVIDTLVDIVSKNGCLLLNVGPQADGRIPEKARTMLVAIGDWLRTNGEAIYATRPWIMFGEGPTRNAGGGFSEQKDRPYTAEDIRFTTRGENTLYAIALDWPASGRLLVKSLARPYGDRVRGVSLLGSGAKIKWKQTAEGLDITLPAAKPAGWGDYAFAFKLTTGTRLRSAAP